MEIAAAKLEALINQASTVLDTAAFELNVKFKKETKMQSSLIGLIQMVHDMAKEIEDIKREAADLFTDQEEIKQKLMQSLPNLFKKLQELEDGSNNNNACSNNSTCSNLRNKLDNLHV